MTNFHRPEWGSSVCKWVRMVWCNQEEGRTHTHIFHIYVHTSHFHFHSQSHSYSHFHWYTHSHFHSHSQTHTHTHTPTLSVSRTQTHPISILTQHHTHTHIDTYSHVFTITHEIHTNSYSQPHFQTIHTLLRTYVPHFRVPVISPTVSFVSQTQVILVFDNEISVDHLSTWRIWGWRWGSGLGSNVNGLG